MPQRRILSLWFPRLAAERFLRLGRGYSTTPFAVAGNRNGMQVLTSLSFEAEAHGLSPGQPLRDAQAMCSALVTRPSDPLAEAGFLSALRRWAGRFSPWVAEEPPAGLIIDLTGCAHLFGGEGALLVRIDRDCADLGLSVRCGLADTVGAAWALARYAGQPVPLARTGDAIDQEAHATRARAAKRRNWERGGPAPKPDSQTDGPNRIAVPGRTHSALSSLPVLALRIDTDTAAALSRVGLRRIGDLTCMPRAGLARRFGRVLAQRLDQALGAEPEPVSPAGPSLRFAVRMTFPDPIGLEPDIVAAIDRLLPELEARLLARCRAARRLCLQLFRVDGTTQDIEIGLAHPSASASRIRPLLIMKLSGTDAGFGIDCIRIEAVVTELAEARQVNFHPGPGGAARTGPDTSVNDLINRLGTRIGLDAIMRVQPADSNIPEKTSSRVAAAWSGPAGAWPSPPAPRPLVMWPPEPVEAPDRPNPPAGFRWRSRSLVVAAADGPERIAPEWWLDNPEWRSGVRDYWRVTAEGGERLWLYYAYGNAVSSGWFCHGIFA